MSKKNIKIGLDDILSIFQQNPTKILNYKQLSAALGLKDEKQRQMVASFLPKLEEKQLIVLVDKGKYKLKTDAPYVTGIIEIVSTGSAYVTPDNGGDDIYVPARMIRNAFTGDKVKLYVFYNKKRKTYEGEVIEVIERSKTEYVGVIQIANRYGFFIADNNKIHTDIFIPESAINGAKDGEKVICRITDWPAKSKNPVGEIIDVLGTPGNNSVEMHAILADFGLPYKFPEGVEALAENIPSTIPAQEYKKRRDFRNVTTFTIDPFDAKDFDDALSIQKLENGNWEIGVHIADVSYYVAVGDKIDEEAKNRATSIYLVDRVVPMLPEKLSNFVCSLRPNEEKLCFSAVFEMTENGEIKSEWFGKTIICSNKRFTYEEAQEIIEGKEGDFKHEILTLDRLAKKLREERYKKGSINFHSQEVKFRLDENGDPVGVYIKEQKDAHKLIEDFMLLANRKVAEFCTKGAGGKKPVFVYRVHDSPDEEKVRTFGTFLQKLGIAFSFRSQNELSKSFNKLLKDIEGKKESNMISQLAIRTMAKAYYSTKNIGHYGLGFEFYTHFTSPIRRYPDLLVHRILNAILEGKKSDYETSVNSLTQTREKIQHASSIRPFNNKLFTDEKGLEELCKHSSEMERLAAEAERASTKYKQVQYLQKEVGKVFEGIISGVTEWGIYVELIESKCEGLIRLRDMTDDFYVFDEDNYRIIGKRNKKKYQLGDTVFIKVKRADLLKKQLDFTLVKSPVLEKNYNEEWGFEI
jgi:ribonuclease R